MGRSSGTDPRALLSGVSVYVGGHAGHAQGLIEWRGIVCPINVGQIVRMSSVGDTTSVMSGHRYRRLS